MQLNEIQDNIPTPVESEAPSTQPTPSQVNSTLSPMVGGTQQQIYANQPKLKKSRYSNTYLFLFRMVILIAIAVIGTTYYLVKFNENNKTVTYSPPPALSSAESAFVSDLANDSPTACTYVDQSQTTDYFNSTCQADFSAWYSALSSEAKHIVSNKVKPQWKLTIGSNQYGDFKTSEVTVGYGPYPGNLPNGNGSAVLLWNFIGGQVWQQTGSNKSWQVIL